MPESRTAPPFIPRESPLPLHHSLTTFMFIEDLRRHMAVSSLQGALRLVDIDKGFWNVLSIRGPREQKAGWRSARCVHYSCFDDVEDEHSTKHHSPRAADIAEVFDFIRALGEGPPSPPLLIHCAQGISRSPALALSWIYGRLPESSNRAQKAVDLVLALQPRAKPNRLVLVLGLAQHVGNDKAPGLADCMLADPRLMRNRFLPPDES